VRLSSVLLFQIERALFRVYYNDELSGPFTYDRVRGINRCMGHAKLQLPVPFEELMQRHQREIMRYLVRVSGDREDAADLFQETWLRAYRAYPRLEVERETRPWLYAIATNLCRNRARDNTRRARVVVPDRKELPAADTIRKDHRFDHENEGYAAVHIRELISDLPTKQRQALHLRYFAGLGYTEIAVAMGCSEDSARTNVSQAVKKLKAKW
jgi:RNA polymerase sigma-70 factor, ECF subfamily